MPKSRDLHGGQAEPRAPIPGQCPSLDAVLPCKQHANNEDSSSHRESRSKDWNTDTPSMPCPADVETRTGFWSRMDHVLGHHNGDTNERILDKGPCVQVAGGRKSRSLALLGFLLGDLLAGASAFALHNFARRTYLDGNKVTSSPPPSASIAIASVITYFAAMGHQYYRQRTFPYQDAALTTAVGLGALAGSLVQLPVNFILLGILPGCALAATVSVFLYMLFAVGRHHQPRVNCDMHHRPKSPVPPHADIEAFYNPSGFQPGPGGAVQRGQGFRDPTPQDYPPYWSLFLGVHRETKELVMEVLQKNKITHPLQAYQIKLLMLEQQNKLALVMAQERDNNNPALQDDQMQLILLEQKNKMRLMTHCQLLDAGVAPELITSI